MIKIGVIADDFTGATDIASFLVENGLPTVQINGVPTGKMPEAIAGGTELVATARLQTDLFQILLYFRQFGER